MKKKIEYTKLFLDNTNILICPQCNKHLNCIDGNLVCQNRHSFNIKKNGALFLINSSNYKQSKMYTKDLFIERRNFINNGFYNEIYTEIVKLIDTNCSNNNVILDLGCGESTHAYNIMAKLKKHLKWTGLDYSKDAIDLSTDYLNGENIFLVGDVNNIPLKNNSVDVILDFLSPFNNLDSFRVLKKNGLLIKIIPDEMYLNELREIFNLEPYTPNTYLNNKFNLIKSSVIRNTYKVCNDSDKKYLSNFTPLTWNKNLDYRKIDSITISLKILVFKKEI